MYFKVREGVKAGHVEHVAISGAATYSRVGSGPGSCQYGQKLAPLPVLPSSFEKVPVRSTGTGRFG